MEYRRRVLDDLLDEYVDGLAAVALDGAKAVGKTATGRQRAIAMFALDDAGQREVVRASPHMVVQSPGPVLIDEWQLEPQVWDVVRRAVDEGADPGSFFLTGSAAAPSDARIHSGAGRIVSVLMRPMSLQERWGDRAAVSLGALLAGTQEVQGVTHRVLGDYVDELVRSGFPGIRELAPQVRGVQLDGYLRRIVERELPENGISVRRPSVLMAWLRAYGAATSTTAGYTTILDAATPGEAEKPSRQAVAGYRDHLVRIYVVEPLAAWDASMTPLTRLTVTPKHHLVDPALAARLAGTDPAALLTGGGTRVGADGGTWLGALFESLVTQSVRVYAQRWESTVSHLRTKNGDHEVDLIVEGADRSVVAIEVKMSGTVDDRDVRHLHWLKAQLGDRMRDAVVVTTGAHAYRRPDGIAVVPFALLGA